MFREGADALRQRDIDRAQELFEKIVAQDPDYKGAHFNLGLAMASRGRFPEALEQFRKEEKISPENPGSYQMIATYLTRVNRRDEAIQEWRKLLKVDRQNRTAASTLADLLYLAEKYPDAVEVLETAVKSAPDSAVLQLQLGNAYVKTGQNDKALATLREVVELKGDDPATLNDVAYLLADSKINLPLAQQYSEKAVQKLEEHSQDSQSSAEVELRATFDLSMNWDTLGWVYFQQGDAKRAEPLVRAAWLLGEDQVVAEHLGEIYEKQGKTQQAAHLYEQALAVSPAVKPIPGLPGADAVNSTLKQEDAIRARYEKLTGKKPSTQIHRLPTGEWTLTPAEQLRRSREIHLSNQGRLSGTAHFTVSLKPGKVDSVHFVSGDNSLEKLSDKLKAAKFPQEFPPDSGAILVLRVEVVCQATTPCVGSFMPALPVSSISPIALQ